MADLLPHIWKPLRHLSSILVSGFGTERELLALARGGAEVMRAASFLLQYITPCRARSLYKVGRQF